MRKSIFNAEQDAIIVANFTKLTRTELEKLLPGFAYNTIDKRARQTFGLKRTYTPGMKRHPSVWTDEKKELVKEHYGKMPIEDLVALIGGEAMTASKVHAVAKRLKLTSKRPKMSIEERKKRHVLSAKKYRDTYNAKKKSVKVVPVKSKIEKVAKGSEPKVKESRSKTPLLAKSKADKRTTEPRMFKTRKIDTSNCTELKIGNMIVMVKPGRDPEEVRQRILNRESTRIASF